MATNNDGHLVDSAGKVAIDFVWGNLPLQPNDERDVAALLDFTLDNHMIAETAWNGYPLYVPNTDGAAIDSDNPADGIQADEIFIVVPAVVGKTTVNAVKALKDAGFGTVTTAAAATNAAIVVTGVDRTALSTTATITAVGAGAAFPVGTQITVSALADANVEFNGTWTVTATTTNSVSFVSLASTAVSATLLTGSVVGLVGTIKTQSVAAAAASIAPAAAITITPYAVAS